MSSFQLKIIMHYYLTLALCCQAAKSLLELNKLDELTSILQKMCSTYFLWRSGFHAYSVCIGQGSGNIIYTLETFLHLCRPLNAIRWVLSSQEVLVYSALSA